MSIKRYISRGIRYILYGTPIIHTTANVVKLSESELLKDRCALITGGSSGIGYSIAEAFLNAGANVIITGRDQTRLYKAIDSLKAGTTRKITGVTFDNQNIENATYVLGKLLKETNVDILVNNAGVNGGNLKTCTEEEYQTIMDTNLKSVVFITRFISEDMKAKNIKGNILNICSSSSLRPANSAYVLSKWGIRGYTLGLAKQLVKYGITVNGLAPGPTATSMLLKGDESNLTLSNNPSGRYALPEEIANMAVVLTSEMGRMIVGDIVYMTGGAGVITIDDINY